MVGHHAGAGQRPAEESPAADLYDRYGAFILAYLRQHTASREDAEDLLLDIFVAALEQDQLAAVPEGERVRWLQRVARNKMVDHYRRSTRRLTVPLEQGTELLEMDAALTPEQVVLRQEEQAHLLGPGGGSKQGGSTTKGMGCPYPLFLLLQFKLEDQYVPYWRVHVVPIKLFLSTCTHSAQVLAFREADFRIVF